MQQKIKDLELKRKKIEQLISKEQNINIRKNGVSVDLNFLFTLSQSNRQLTSQHIIFFLNLFRKYFNRTRKIFVADQYFFVEFMPNLTISIDNNLINVQHTQDNQFLVQEQNDQKIKITQNQNQQMEEKIKNDQQQQSLQKPKIKLISPNPDKITQPQNIVYQQQTTKPSQEKSINQQDQIILQQNDQVTQKQKIIIQEQTNIQIQQPPQQLQQNQQQSQQPAWAKFNFQITNVEVKKIEEGIFKFQKMKDMLDNFSKEQQLSNIFNPIFELGLGFFPINLKNKHWVSLSVDINKEEICYQDSCYYFNKDLVTGIKHILSYKQNRNIDWKLLTNTPQQGKSEDCGAFVLYTLYFMYKKGKLIDKDSFDQFLIYHFRLNLVILALEELISNELSNQKVIEILDQE